jgi:NAD(P)-dependent dehydrogenase (short-subunit alcohol dehydrogenase family)
VADLNEDLGKQVAADIGGHFVKTNVADEDSVREMVAAAAASGRPLRTAVSCAGIGFAARTVGRDGSPHELAGFTKVIAVNLTGTFNVLRFAAAAMAKTERCDHQHLLSRGYRGTDRADRLLRLEGRDHRDDRARRA